MVKRGKEFALLFVFLIFSTVLITNFISAADCNGYLNCGAITIDAQCRYAYSGVCTWTGSYCINVGGASCSMITTQFSCGSVGCTWTVTTPPPPTCTTVSTTYSCTNQKVIVIVLDSCGDTTTTTIADCYANSYYCNEGQTSSSYFSCLPIPTQAQTATPTYVPQEYSSPGSCNFPSSNIDTGGNAWTGITSIVPGIHCTANSDFGCTHRTSSHSCFVHNCMTGSCPSGFPLTSCPLWGASYPKGQAACEADGQGGGTGCDWLAWASCSCYYGSDQVYFKDADNDGYGSGTGHCLCVADSTYKVTNNNDCNDNNAALNIQSGCCAPACSGKNCGSNGCGGTCGSCGSGYSCSLGLCTPICSPATCSSLGKSCGSWDNGCGTGTLNCGSCNDGNSCTTDSCSASGSCVYTPLTGTACTSDGNECTNDVCNALGTCIHPALTGDDCSSDGNSCTADSCTALGACGHPALTGDSCTTDNNACTEDICSSGGSCAHNNIGSCIGGDGCCPNGCNSGNDNDCTICTPATQAADCTEGNSCTTPICSGGTCSYPPISGCCTVSSDCPTIACKTKICSGTCSYITINNCCTSSSDCSGSDTCIGNTCTATGYCGDGDVNQAWEECDGSDLNEETCASVLGSGYTGNLGCSGCYFDTSGCYETVIPPTIDCPDGYCDSGAGETCRNCAADCGTCPPGQVCGNGVIEGSEECDDHDTSSGDGCSSSCYVESGWSCYGEPSSCSPDVGCGDNICNNGENCETCADDCGACDYCGNGYCDHGENCATCDTDCGCSGSQVCQSGSCVSLCGNGLINSGEDCDGGNLGGETCTSVLGPEYIGDLGCSNCYFDTGGCYLACKLTSASWSKTMALEGDQIKLNINGENCDGQTISFIVMEKDGFLNGDDPVEKDPASIIYGSPSTYGIWTVEWQDDSEFGQSNPPEYYFTATAEQGATITSSKTDGDMFNAYQEDVVCSGVNYCANYLTEDKCQVDLCSVGVASAPSSVSCGGTFNPETGCYDYTNCGCTWDSSAKTCETNWQSESSCDVCGNHVKDTGEECDDGNLIDGDGCSSICQYESGIPSPCTEGLTLCSDGTCSLNCDVTDEGVASCNYNGVCNVGEGCTCQDCNGEQDTCKNGLICNIIDSACCSSTSNNECNPYCAFVDPDCAPSRCGNGFRELGEECDLGTRNNLSNSGCSSTCKYVILEPPCTEGTNLCNDDTCSLNCFATDEGIKGCGEAGACAVGLQCSPEDKACCKWSPDGFCDSYCAFVDPDCKTNLLEEGIFSIGTCLYTETGTDTCTGDGMLTRSLSAQWNWSADNSFSSNPDGLDYWQPEDSEVFHYDPLDYSGLRKSQNCVYIEDTFACPASAQVSFFGIYQLVIAIALVVLIYLIYALRKKNNSKHTRRHSKITVRKRRK